MGQEGGEQRNKDTSRVKKQDLPREVNRRVGLEKLQKKGATQRGQRTTWAREQTSQNKKELQWDSRIQEDPDKRPQEKLRKTQF